MTTITTLPHPSTTRPSRSTRLAVAISAAALVTAVVTPAAMASRPTPGDGLAVHVVAASTNQAVHAPAVFGAVGATGMMYV